MSEALQSLRRFMYTVLTYLKVIKYYNYDTNINFKNGNNQMSKTLQVLQVLKKK